MEVAGGHAQIEREAQSLPPGQHARRDFPRFGTHLHLPPPTIPDDPVIEIDGAVDSPLSVSTADLSVLPRIQVTAGLHCVSGWSATGLRWEGVSFASFYRHFIEPAVTADAPRWLILEGFDGYRVVEYLDDALAADVVLADRLDGQPLNTDHGGPLRFVSPDQYGYVSAKHLARIELSVEEPDENYGYVHPLGWLVMRPPFFWRHPRARVWREERNRRLPAWILRLVYPPLRPPIRWLSRRGADKTGPRGAKGR